MLTAHCVASAESLYHESTVQSADSIEAHPSISGLFALGTYQVNQHEEQKSTTEDAEDEQQSSSSPEYSRKGTLRLKRVKTEPDGSLTRSVLPPSALLSKVSRTDGALCPLLEQHKYCRN